MRINIEKLPFCIPDNPFEKSKEKLSGLIKDLENIEGNAGVNSEKFSRAEKKIVDAVESGYALEHSIENKIDIRALAFVLSSTKIKQVKLTKSVLNKIRAISIDKPNNLIIESIFQYFLHKYNQIDDKDSVIYWLNLARKFRKLDQWYDSTLISSGGPKWVAIYAIENNKEFDEILYELCLDKYQSGQFMELAQNIYYVEQLKSIPVNKPHKLLLEVQKEKVYRAKFDDHGLLGYQVLNILIERAPLNDIHESWLNVIMAIAGDPRVSKSHDRYITWWRHISPDFVSKVRGWLSRLDLKLFLEALEDFSTSSHNIEMQRMYPSRKQFLEGLYDKDLIQNTRLYMSRRMAGFLKKNYKPEHLPNFSIVADGDKSIIYVDLGDAHLIEGSHICYLWIYKRLDSSATVFDYDKSPEKYSELTSNLDGKMQKKGCGSKANITHTPSNFGWQRKAIETLQSLNVLVTIKDVLTDKDYRTYLRQFGVE